MPDYPANDDQPAAKASGSLASFFGETGTTTTENTMRIFLFGLSIAAIATANVASSTPPRSSVVSTVCLPADRYTDFQIAALKVIVAGNDSSSVSFRQNTHIPAVADTAIHLESDSAKCARALVTFNANMDSGTVAALYLIRVGNVYVGSINDMPATKREWTEQLVMDSAFTHIGTYLR